MLSVTNNVSSLIAQNNLNMTSNALQTSLQRLSSGLKINSGADGPAALVISNEQQAQVVGLQTAISNTSQAANIVQIADGALGTISNLLDQIRSLALDSANAGANDSTAMAANQAEVSNALQTINRIAQNTQFGTKVLLDGSSGLTGSSDNANVTFLNANSGAPTGANLAVVVTQAGTRADAIAGTAQTGPLATAETLTINGVSINLSAGLTQQEVVNTINEYTNQTGVVAKINGGNGPTELYSTNFGSGAAITVQSNVNASATSTGFGTLLQTFNGTDVQGTINGVAAVGVGNVLTGTAGGTGAVSVAIAGEPTSGANYLSTYSNDLGTANVNITDNSLVFQIGANANQTTTVTVGNMQTTALGLSVTGVQFANLSAVNVQTASGAQDTIKVVDAAIDEVSALSGQLGAIQANTLQQSANNLNATLQNTTATLSTIRDTNFAEETAKYSQSQVLMQVGSTVLSNANQTSALILNLMKNL
jgi:flagellin